MVGVNEADRSALEALGLTTRAAKTRGRSWRFETVRADFGELMAIAKRIRTQLDGRYVLQGQMLGRSLPFITAASIRPGMVVATESADFDVVERISHEDFEAEVFDLNIARTHNFIANGIVTHNSIYRWRGARVENLHKFREDFPQAKLLRLEQNYRSTGAILDAANALIANNSGRLGKTLWTSGPHGAPVKLFAAFNERDEADFVVTRILEWTQRGGLRRETAILYRSNAQSRAFEEALIMARVPYRVYGGLRFFERAEVKDALAYLRLITNRADDASFERIVNLPTRGIGAKSLDNLRATARVTGGSLWQAAAAAAEAREAGRPMTAMLGFMQLIEKLTHAIEGLPLHEQVDQVINASGLIEHHQKDKADRGEARVENLLELVSAARGFEPDRDLSPLQSFLSHAVLESGEGQGEAGEDCVQMMTLHSAKGLEFPLVFLCGMEDGLFPHQRSINDLDGLEEERRLCYVGTTRAMKQLYFTYAEQRRLHGVDSYNSPSRFIREIPPALIEEVRPRIRVSHAAPSVMAAAGARAPNRGALSETIGDGMHLGTRVRHGKFGEGVVLNVEGQGPHARVQVNFEQQGSKWLMLQYANLEVMRP